MTMKTPPCLLSPKYAPKIEVTHPNVPDGSQERLVDKRAQSPPYHGQDNPAFTFDTATLFSRAPSRVDHLVTTDDLPLYRSLPPVRRGSYSPFLPATDKDSLAVPVFGVRRQSLSSSWGRENVGVAGAAGGPLSSPQRRLKPLQSLSIDNVTSDYRSQNVPSPGMFSTKSMWSTSDLMLSPGPFQDMETMSKATLSVPRDGSLSIFSSDTDLPVSLGTSSLSNVSGSLGERMHELVRAFSSRTQRCKEKISQPPTPSSTSSYDDAKSAVSGGDDPPQPRDIRFGSFMPMGSRTSDAFSDPGQGFVGVGHCRFKLPRCCKKFRFPETFESYSKLYVTWLFVVMLSYVYNSSVIPLRGVFPYQTRDNWMYWLVADYVCDVIYLIDIIVFKTRLRFTHNGIVETNFQQTKKHYTRKWIFKADILSLLPLDLVYAMVESPWQRRYVWLRLPRMLKIQTFWEFYARCDQAAKSSAHAVRIIKTMTYMLYLIHIETCGYYGVSEYEGLNSNRWVYNNQGNAYIRCFYLATKTATSIGNNPKPTNTLEYMFMTLYWLSGVFVFALLIGQIRDIVEAAGQVNNSYRKKMDSALHYMQSINISKNIQDKARKWFLYNWEQSKTIDERNLVAALPKKLQTDLAINVHFNTLSKVQLFQDCERNLLYDLVLKLRPNLFLPGDYVCQKGEVGKEMYIVSQGQVEVVGGENNEVVLATLSEGSVFGEISLLAMSGRGNRRTADVRSKGYTNVFTLSKWDFEEAMNEYPEAQKVLKKRAKKLLKENAKKMEKKNQVVVAEEIIKTPNETPKMVKTVIQVLKPESTTGQKLRPSVKRPHTSVDNRHLRVPGPVRKGLRQRDHAKRNMAFDFSDENIKPSIRTQSCGNNEDDSDDDDELLVVERIEQSLPQPDINDNDVDDVDDLLNADDDDDDDLFADGPFLSSENPKGSSLSSYEAEFFENVMSELRAQDVIGRDDREQHESKRKSKKESKHKKGSDDSSKNGGSKKKKSSKDKKGKGKASSETQGERKSSEEITNGGRKTSGETEGNRKTSGETEGSRKTSENTTEASRKTSQDSQQGRRITDVSDSQDKQAKVGESVEHQKTSEERKSGGEEGRKRSEEDEGRRKRSGEKERKRSGGKEEETSGATDDGELTRTSLESQDSGLPSMKRSASQSTDKSLSQQDSKESFNSGDLTTAAAAAAQQARDQKASGGNPGTVAAENADGRSSGLSGQQLGNLVTVGLGGVCAQDSSAVSTNATNTSTSRLRKVSTVSLPQLPGEGDDTAASTPTPTPIRTNKSDTQVNQLRDITQQIHSLASGSSMTPIESSTVFSRQLNGVASRQESAAGSQCKIPPENQITCAVEIHREKTKTPTTMLAMTEQPSSRNNGGGTAAAAAAAATGSNAAGVSGGGNVASAAGTTTTSSTPRNSPAPPMRSPLPHEMCHMRETIV